MTLIEKYGEKKLKAFYAELSKELVKVREDVHKKRECTERIAHKHDIDLDDFPRHFSSGRYKPVNPSQPQLFENPSFHKRR